MLRDKVCKGWVVHRRRGPGHGFRYPVWMLFVDVERIGALRSRWLSSRSRLAPLSLRPGDFPRDTGLPARAGIRSTVNGWLEAHGLPAAERVFLLAQPRSFGFLFNPVSFYFCYRNNELSAVVAEITNTPWGEVFRYVLDARGADGHLCREFPKSFHVSPFQPMDVLYRWRIEQRDDVIEVAMALLRDGQETFFAGLYLHAQPVSDGALGRAAWRYPLQTARTLTRIYWQALRLWLKGAPFHVHPRKLQEVSSP